MPEDIKQKHNKRSFHLDSYFKHRDSGFVNLLQTGQQRFQARPLQKERTFGKILDSSSRTGRLGSILIGSAHQHAAHNPNIIPPDLNSAEQKGGTDGNE